MNFLASHSSDCTIHPQHSDSIFANLPTCYNLLVTPKLILSSGICAQLQKHGVTSPVLDRKQVSVSCRIFVLYACDFASKHEEVAACLKYVCEMSFL